MTDVIIYVLLAVNVFQTVYWSSVQKNLIDRLMSRNYAEYVQVSKPPLPTVKLDLENTVDEQDVLKELNGMMGV